MAQESIRIMLNGEEVADIYPDLLLLDVEEDEELASMFRMRLAIRLQPDGVWTHIDDERLALWSEVSIEAGFDGDVEEIMSGYITHLKPSFSSEQGACVLDVWGLDRSVLLDREEKLKDWPSRKDSDIASEILSQYGFTADAEDTSVVHDETVSTIIQRETDMQFLRRLAARNGYECYVSGTTGYFRRPATSETPQPVLAVHFGDETNVNSFDIEVNALEPADIAMSQMDRQNKEMVDAESVPDSGSLLGSSDYASLLQSGAPQGKLFIGMSTATGTPEMSALCQGIYEQASWFVTGSGEINANKYSHVLRARKPVTIKGIGETHSGVYYVTHVTHRFAQDGYIQQFRVKRNAVLPTGSEQFSESAGMLGGLL
jgi:phage protein D